jgi:hypothetical protein
VERVAPLYKFEGRGSISRCEEKEDDRRIRRDVVYLHL